MSLITMGYRTMNMMRRITIEHMLLSSSTLNIHGTHQSRFVMRSTTTTTTEPCHPLTVTHPVSAQTNHVVLKKKGLLLTHSSITTLSITCTHLRRYHQSPLHQYSSKPHSNKTTAKHSHSSAGREDGPSGKMNKIKEIWNAFSVGFKEFYRDGKDVADIVMKMKREKLSIDELTVDELIHCHNFTRAFQKTLPLLIVSMVPFCFYLIVPVICLFPKQLLSRYFWTQKQKRLFDRQNDNQSQLCQKSALHHLEKHLQTLGPQGIHTANIIKQISTDGGLLSRSEFELIEQEFNKHELTFKHLNSRHMKELAVSFSTISLIYLLPLIQYRVNSEVKIYHLVDNAIMAAGGPTTLQLEQISKICHMRGLALTYTNEKQLREYLNHWLKVSANISSINEVKFRCFYVHMMLLHSQSYQKKHPPYPSQTLTPLTH